MFGLTLVLTAISGYLIVSCCCSWMRVLRGRNSSTLLLVKHSMMFRAFTGKIAILNSVTTVYYFIVKMILKW